MAERAFKALVAQGYFDGEPFGSLMLALPDNVGCPAAERLLDSRRFLCRFSDGSVLSVSARPCAGSGSGLCVASGSPR